MNTTIKDLSFEWWCKLTPIERNDIRDKMGIPNELGKHFTNEQIENIFYKEVIVKWANESENRENYYCLAPVFIKQAYLKEHIKEQPIYDGDGKLISGQLKNEWVSCEGYLAQEYPDFKKGWGVECYNGTKGMVEAYNTPYLYIEGQVDLIHKMNIKAYMTFEQPQSVDNTIDVEEERERGIVITNVSQPKAIEDNLWDEARRGYKKLTHRSILSNGEHALLDYMEQHYSLIKK
jgi:hypothetical protein